jgi:hypothetical protein
MRPLERLLYASDAELTRLFGHLVGQSTVATDAFLDEVARDLGLERTQLICGLGFNTNLLRAPGIVNALGFESFNNLWRARNAVFVDDNNANGTGSGNIVVGDRNNADGDGSGNASWSTRPWTLGT